MKKSLILGVIATTGFMLSGAASANHHEKDGKAMMKPTASKDGKTVMVDGKEVAVCSKTVMDSCINPREAGLKYGNVPLKYWPGKPASEM